jgi:hypothetical protein
VFYRNAQAGARSGVRCELQILGRGAQADALGTAQVLDRGAQAVARGSARCASQELDRYAKPLPAAPLVVCRRYLIAVPC